MWIFILDPPCPTVEGQMAACSIDGGVLYASGLLSPANHRSSVLNAIYHVCSIDVQAKG